MIVAPPFATNPAAAEETATAKEPLAEPASDKTIKKLFDDSLNWFNGKIAAAMFFDISFGAFQHPVIDEETRQPVLEDNGKVKREGPTLKFMVVFLAIGAIFFTFWHRFINLRGFKHALDITRGKYTNKDDPGEITPFRALTSALSATVGLGNIAGVAIAVKTGGPGAVFWMMVLGLFGMTAKFHETTLAQLFRRENADGTISGGPMYYLDKGLAAMGPQMGVLGKALAWIFAIFCIGGALGGGNMFQSNQAFEGFYSTFVAEKSLPELHRGSLPVEKIRGLLNEAQLEAAMTREQRVAQTPLEEVRAVLDEQRVRHIARPSQLATLLPEKQVKADQKQRANRKGLASIGFGLLMATLVGAVVIGGITRIGAATSRIVPSMCLLYVLGCLVVIIANVEAIPKMIAMVFANAFAFQSAWGGLVGVLIIGFQRAAFSSEAGLGSSAIAHSAAKTSEPVREGFVASLEPFVDTIVICFMTAMMVMVTGAYNAAELVEETNGTAVTLYAFQQTGILAGWFPTVLSISVILFAFSTMISWCYYGERAYGYLFGLKTVVLFRILFVSCVFFGAVASLGPVLNFADLMILSMAFPNILGGILLAGLVRRKLKDYWSRYSRGQMSIVDGKE